VNHILQLGLNKLRKPDSADRSVQIVWLIDQLLELIFENLIEDDESTGFRSQLEGLRREILDIGGPKIPSPTALDVLNLCRNEFKRSRIRRTQREEQFAEIITFLRKALANLTGDANTFHDNLLETSGRINGLMDVKDIQELKLKVAAEVKELNRIAVEKHEREKVQFAQLSEQVTVLQRKLEAARAEASIDGLTGIANRRNFDYTIQRWVIAHEKSEGPFTVAIIDIDNFKQINDSYGHPVGDQVLTSAATELGRNIRSSDFLARYGGDEFAILSAGMKLLESERRFSTLLQSMGETVLECKNAEDKTTRISLTASCGVAEYALGESAKDLIHRADDAMYEAKKQGKNRVVTTKRNLLGAYYEGRKRNTPA
jgi:diguanylate cyclase (GGDEF)-like protein